MENGFISLADAAEVLGLPEPVPTISVVEAGRLLGLGRDASYAAAKAGEIPCVKVGRRLRASVPRLAGLLLGETAA